MCNNNGIKGTGKTTEMTLPDKVIAATAHLSNLIHKNSRTKGDSGRRACEIRDEEVVELIKLARQTEKDHHAERARDASHLSELSNDKAFLLSRIRQLNEWVRQEGMAPSMEFLFRDDVVLSFNTAEVGSWSERMAMKVKTTDVDKSCQSRVHLAHDSGTFLAARHFMQTNDLNCASEITRLMDLIRFCDDFDLQDLKAKCLQQLRELDITSESVAFLLQVANEQGLVTLKKHVIDWVTSLRKDSLRHETSDHIIIKSESPHKSWRRFTDLELKMFLQILTVENVQQLLRAGMNSLFSQEFYRLEFINQWRKQHTSLCQTLDVTELLDCINWGALSVMQLSQELDNSMFCDDSNEGEGAVSHMREKIEQHVKHAMRRKVDSKSAPPIKKRSREDVNMYADEDRILKLIRLIQ